MSTRDVTPVMEIRQEESGKRFHCIHESGVLDICCNTSRRLAMIEMISTR